MRAATLTFLMLASGSAWAQDACIVLAQSAPTVEAPALAPELAAPSFNLGAPSGVLAQSLADAMSADAVLLRLRIEKCRTAAMSMQPSVPGLVDAATYTPKTEFDNTPWRFDMNQNGKRMTAEEFDAWMKAKGVRVAKGAQPVVVPAPAPAPAEGTQN